jgi:hypothetical protein
MDEQTVENTNKIIEAELNNENIKTQSNKELDKKAKKKLREEKVAQKKLEKKQKAKEKYTKIASTPRSEVSKYDKNKVKTQAPKLDEFSNICDDISLILKDKINNNKIDISLLERKSIDKFIEMVSKRINMIPTSQSMSSVGNSAGNCSNKNRCIIWNCYRKHPKTRKEECDCNEAKCDKLHQYQAICKNPDHPTNCNMAHNMEELKERMETSKLYYPDYYIEIISQYKSKVPSQPQE